jgi:hypothetical protein
MTTITQTTNMSAAKVNAFVKAFMVKAKDTVDDEAYDAIMATWEGQDNQEELENTFKAAAKGWKSKGKGKSKIKDKNAPKRGSSAYIFFCKDHRAEAKKKLGDDASLGDVGKELGSMWNKAKSTKKVAKYNSQAAEDKKRYEREMEAYVPPSEEELEAMAPKKRKKSSGKKRGKSAYMFFCAEERTAIKADKPDLAPKEVMSELGRRWKEAKEGDISKWEKLAKASKEAAAEANSSGPSEDEDSKSSSEEDELVEEIKPTWKTKADKKSGKTFYYNTETKQSQWETPDELDEEAPATKSNSTKSKKKIYAYSFWVKQHRDEVGRSTGFKNKELTKELSKQWKALGQEEKAEWKEKAIAAAE